MIASASILVLKKPSAAWFFSIIFFFSGVFMPRVIQAPANSRLSCGIWAATPPNRVAVPMNLKILVESLFTLFSGLVIILPGSRQQIKASPIAIVN